MFFVLLLSCWLMGLAGTIAVEKLAPSFNLMNAPNERSSHTVPTPRGGGIAIAVVACLAAALLAATGQTQFWSVAGIVALVAGLGLVDDIYDLSPSIRFPIQFVAFVVLIVASPELPAVVLPFDWQLGSVLLTGLVVLIGVWWLNLFNFIDGIDGIAAGQAIILLLAGPLIWCTRGINPLDTGVLWLSLGTAAATTGFLVRNWSPARVFMGDAGSNALAMIIFSIALLTIGVGMMPYYVWLILPSVSVTDTTVTLVRRLARGERPWRAHRRHGYQQLSRQWGHARTAITYLMLTVFWALPMAFLADRFADLGWMLVLVTYAPLVGFAFWSEAGSAVEN